MLHRILHLSIAIATTSTLAFPGICPALAESRDVYIQTVHIDGKTNVNGDATHDPEPFPSAEMPQGHGLQLTAPNEKGEWKMRAFAFLPSQIIVNAGDDVRLHFVGAQGAKHTIEVTGQDVEREFSLTRGQIETVEIESVVAGTIKIECYDHQPNMNAVVTVLP